MPERGFHYFPSPDDRDDDFENIAHEFFYCSTAVEEWPAFRQHLETTGLRSRQQCDGIEKNAIEIFRQVKDGMARFLETGNWDSWPPPGLLQRLMLAHAYLALHADPAGMGDYRNMAWSEIQQDAQAALPRTADFARALWEGRWNQKSAATPLDAIRHDTRYAAKSHADDGLYDTVNRRGVNRRDPVARAYEPLESLGDRPQYIDSLFLTSKPINSAFEESQLLELISELKSHASSTSMTKAFNRAAARQLFIRAGVKPKHASFGARILYDDAKRKENPTAWKAIYRKRRQLLDEARKIFGATWGEKFISLLES